MGVRSRRSNPKRRRAATVSVGDSGGGGGVDLISGLSDDLLLRILDLVPDAENVVRTHALSRRWRGLWTGVAALRFDFSSGRKLCRSDAAAERYIAFVNGALALRATAKEPRFRFAGQTLPRNGTLPSSMALSRFVLPPRRSPLSLRTWPSRSTYLNKKQDS
jgi:hypothetical protein